MTKWNMKGTILQSCNCDYGCPCNFNAPPTDGHCEGQWTWHVEQGRYGEIDLSGLNFSVAADWPGTIHHGDGEAVVLIDERANDVQRRAILNLLGGQEGGPWAIIATTFSKVHGPKYVPYDVAIDGARSRLQAGSAITLEMEPIKNPVTGAEAFPQVVLPQGFVYKESTRASSKAFSVIDDIRFDYQGKDCAIAPFDYSGP